MSMNTVPLTKGFQYQEAGFFICSRYKNGQWSEPAEQEGSSLSLSIAATCLNYGQACFEGLKAFKQPNGKIGIFRVDAHGARLRRSAARLAMQAPNEILFRKAVSLAVKRSSELLPLKDRSRSLYIRPILLGTEPVIGVRASDEYLFAVFSMPVGNYYNRETEVRAYIHDDYDRAALNGVGSVKAAGNYAAALVPDQIAKKTGFDVSLFLDNTHQFIDEFSTSNFIAIRRDNGAFVTPTSPSILESITNVSLQALAQQRGLAVYKERISWERLSEFAEVGACGTAAVVTPISSITKGEKTFIYNVGSDQSVLLALASKLQRIQYGEEADALGWMTTT